MKKNKEVYFLAILLLSFLFLSMVSTQPLVSNNLSQDAMKVKEFDKNSQPQMLDPLQSKVTQPSAVNATFYLDTIVDGTYDEEGDGFIDYYYINITVEILVTGDYLLTAALNLSQQDPNEPFPYVYGWDMRAEMMEGPPSGFFGSELGNETVTIVFKGTSINATGIGLQPLVITNFMMFDMANFNPEGEDMPPVVALEGDSMGYPSSTNLFESSQNYEASDFEQWKFAFIQSYGDATFDFNGDGIYERFLIQATVNATADMWVNVYVGLEGLLVNNHTYVSAGLTVVNLWYSGQEITDFGLGFGPYDVSEAFIEVYLPEYQYFNEIWGDYDTPLYTTTSPAVTGWESSSPMVTILADNSTWTSEMIDEDNNLLYDHFKVTINATFTAFHSYKFVAQLRMSDADGYGISTTHVDWYTQGNHTVDLIFDIRELISVSTYARYEIQDYFLGNATQPINNFTRWNFLRVKAYPTDNFNYDSDWHIRKFFNNTHELLMEDFDVLSSEVTSSANFPHEITDQAYLGEQFITWFNVKSDVFSTHNILNWTINIMNAMPPGLLDFTEFGFVIQWYEYNFSYVAGGYPFDYRGYHSDLQALTAEEFIPLYRYGDSIWLKLAVEIHNFNMIPKMPMTYSLQQDFDALTDFTPPEVNFLLPANSTTFSDEFRFKFKINATDAETTVGRLDIFREGNAFPFASTNPDFWYMMPSYSGTYDDILKIHFLENGYVEFYCFPDWIGTDLEFRVDAVDPANNIGSDNLYLTFVDDPPNPPEDLINHGLKWIIEAQYPDGSYHWSREDLRGHEDPSQASCAFTGWAILSLLQNGSRYDHPTIQAGWNFIKDHIQPDGSIYAISDANYETSICLMGLIPLKISYDLWGVANPELDAAIANAVNYLILEQNIENNGYTNEMEFYGGWGYGWSNISRGETYWSDLSNTQWVIIALAAAEDLGLTVPQTTWDKAEIFIRNCFTEGGMVWDDDLGQEVQTYGFAYQPPEEEYGGWPQATMDAAGIWCLSLMGYEPTDPNISLALEWMKYNWDQYTNPSFDGMGYRYYALLSASKALLLTGNYDADTSTYGWMYDDIIDFFRTQAIQNSTNPDLWYWDNTYGSEDPTYATLEAVVAQQVGFGAIGEADYLAVTATGVDNHLHMEFDDGGYTGLDYESGQLYIAGNTTYSGPSSYPQQIIRDNPYKGMYTAYVVPMDDGEITLTFEAKTDTGLTVKLVNATFTATKWKPYLLNFTLTTIYGVNIDIGPVEEYPTGDWEVSVDTLTFGDVDYLTHPDTLEVTPGGNFTIWIDLSKITGTGSELPFVSVYADEDFEIATQSFRPVAYPAAVEFEVDVSTSAANNSVHPIWVMICSLDMTNYILMEYSVKVINQTVAVSYTIDINSPTDGATIQGNTIIDWTASSSPPTAMTYLVEYSMDNGATWTNIAGELSANQYAWDTTQVADGTYLLKVTIEGTDVADQIQVMVENEVPTTTSATSSTSESSSESSESQVPEFSPFPLLPSIIGLIALPLILSRRRRK